MTGIRNLAGISLVAILWLCAGAGAAQVPPQSQELPDGPGKVILLKSCTSCHELTEVTKFRGYYTRDEWRDVVVTMVKYGADVKERDVPVLTDYLFTTLGKKTPAP